MKNLSTPFTHIKCRKNKTKQKNQNQDKNIKQASKKTKNRNKNKDKGTSTVGDVGEWERRLAEHALSPVFHTMASSGKTGILP